jgi:threonine dehydrogenase-like Zn-dependent dehydrogenase
VSPPTLPRTMRAFVLTAPGECSVQEVPAPVAASGEAVIDVERVGVCGTDVEFFTKGHHHVCEHRQEVGVRGGRPRDAGRATGGAGQLAA